MDLNLQSLASASFLTGQPFIGGDRVASHLVRDAKTPEVNRYDVLENESVSFTPPGFIACRWIHQFKPHRTQVNSERAMKLTAENLFVTLADPLIEQTEENTRLLQFLALMLERKRLLRPKGFTRDGEKNVYEHAKTKQTFEVPVGEISPQFFLRVQEQLGAIVGALKVKGDAPVFAAGASGERAKR